MDEAWVRALVALPFGLAIGSFMTVVVARVPRGESVLRPRSRLVYSVVHPRGGTMGWSRSFETQDGPQAVVTYWHSLTDHERACARARLAIEVTAEPRLPTAIAVTRRERRRRWRSPRTLW